MKNSVSILDRLSVVRNNEDPNGHKSIETRREEIYQAAVERGLFTKTEVDEKYRGQFLDKYGQDSLACYISCAFEKPDGIFVTANPKLLEKRTQLQLRFESKIVSTGEALLQPRDQTFMLDASVLTEMLVEERVQKSAKLAAEGDYPHAIEEADVGLAMDEENLKLRIIRGTAYASTEQMEAAKEDLEWAIQHDENPLPETIHNLGCIYCALKDYSKARALFHQALRIRPDYDLPQKMLEQMAEEAPEAGARPKAGAEKVVDGKKGQENQ